MRHYTAVYDIDGLLESCESILFKDPLDEVTSLVLDPEDLTLLARRGLMHILKIGVEQIKNNWEMLGKIQGTFEWDDEEGKMAGDTYEVVLNTEPISLKEFEDEFDKLSKTNIDRYHGEDTPE